MFDNVGAKIKTLASIVAWLGIIGSVIIGTLIMISAEELAAMGLIIAVIGSVSSWLGSILVYAFGELVDNSAILVDNSKTIARKLNMIISESKDSNTTKQEETVN